jgi:putative transcriptional regulator
VVLITEHSEEGTVGFVLNQKTEFEVEHLINELEGFRSPVYQGGPVQIESFHYIHRYGNIEGSIPISDGLFWSGDFEQIKEGLREGLLQEDQFIFFIGYSGWTSGQLGVELDEKAWIVGELQVDQLFDKNLIDGELWKEAMRALGGDFALLANSPINPQFN